MQPAVASPLEETTYTCEATSSFSRFGNIRFFDASDLSADIVETSTASKAQDSNKPKGASSTVNNKDKDHSNATVSNMEKKEASYTVESGLSRFGNVRLFTPSEIDADAAEPRGVSSSLGSSTSASPAAADTALLRFGNVRLFSASEIESESPPAASSDNNAKASKGKAIGRAEVEAALSRFGNVRLFTAAPVETEQGAGEGGYASGGSVVSLDAGGYRAVSVDSSETHSAASSNLNTPRAALDTAVVRVFMDCCTRLVGFDVKLVSLRLRASRFHLHEAA